MDLRGLPLSPNVEDARGGSRKGNRLDKYTDEELMKMQQYREQSQKFRQDRLQAIAKALANRAG